jgi:hypothetical protein
MEVVSFFNPVPLPPGIQTPVSIEEETGCASEPISMLCKREISLALSGNPISIPRMSSW